MKKTNLNARFIFIAPPSFEELERRLRGRGTETDDKIQVAPCASHGHKSYADALSNEFQCTEFPFMDCKLIALSWTTRATMHDFHVWAEV